MDLFCVESLNVKFKDVVIDDLSFSLSNSSMLGVLCPNGGGKSTLIKSLSGLILSNSGKIMLNGVKITKRNFKRYMLHIGTVYEDIDSQFLCEKVKDELSFPLIHLCYKPKDIKERIDIISQLVRIDKIFDKDISSLSNFEKIKVLIATSIIHLPKVLLLDDVFRLLNRRDSKELMDILNDIRISNDVSIIFTTSSIEDVVDLDNIIVLHEGCRKLNGTFTEIIKEDNELAKIGLEIPIMIDLSRKLQFYNLVDDIYYDVDSVVNKLWK